MHPSVYGLDRRALEAQEILLALDFALYNLKNVDGWSDAMIHRQTCIDCFDTCTPDRPIIAPSIFHGQQAQTYEEAYKGTTYDAFTKAYRCVSI